MATLDSENMNQSNFSKAGFEKLTANEKVDFFVQGYRVPQKQSNAATFEMIRKRIGENESVQVKNVRQLPTYWTAAASIVILAVLASVYFFFSREEIQIVAADRGQHLEYTLPDGSDLKVNADSKITFSGSGFNHKRQLNLNGEAFFSVKKGSPFVVKTPLGKVEVLGTTLNVYSRGNELNVSCHSGKVKVTVHDQSVTILPGEKVSWINGSLQKSTVSNEQKEIGWVSGNFSFENIPLISIFEEIERQFNVSVITKGIEGRYYTGSFRNTKLTEVLETVCLPMNLKYEIKNGNQVIITSNTR